MKNSVIRKNLVCLVIILFIGMSITTLNANSVVQKSTIPNSNGKTLYVGGGGPGNYTKIQDAIDDTVDGDTVFVFDDSSPYFENLVVDKSINLIGEDRNTTIIDGSNHGDVVIIHSNCISIRGFTIKNSGKKSYYDAGIDINSSYNTITNNNILENYCGITTNNRTGRDIFCNIITGNNINSNHYDGIYYRDCDGNTISDNKISNNNGHGIYLSCEHNTIAGKIISSNNGDGIFIPGGSHNTIKGNVIISNNKNGLYFCDNRNTIVGNHISSNKNIGINLRGSHNHFTGLGNTIIGNNITSNNGVGIYLKRARINYILKNNFIDNEEHAFFITAFFNRWDKNYWEGVASSPVRINGMMSFQYDYLGEIIWEVDIPWVNYDRNPTEEPYDIPGSSSFVGCDIN